MLPCVGSDLTDWKKSVDPHATSSTLHMSEGARSATVTVMGLGMAERRRIARWATRPIRRCPRYSRSC